MNGALDYLRDHRFGAISWLLTVTIVSTLLGGTLWWTSRSHALTPVAQTVPTSQSTASYTALPTLPAGSVQTSIPRSMTLQTAAHTGGRESTTIYRVQPGDALFSIAKQFGLKPESILYSNEATLNDNPGNLTPGMELNIPPVDGLTYTWKDGDVLDAIADEFKSDLNGDGKLNAADASLLKDAIISYPANNLDLTNPVIRTGQQVMVPGGQRELVVWLEYVPTYARGSGTATSSIGGGSCSGGSGSPPGVWPTNGPHTLSGNPYGPSHLGIDITATSSTVVLASGSGIVVYAGWSSSGYGNVVQIDHLDGYSTVYAHLSQINVGMCQQVLAGQAIGLAGTTGNSTGVHLHFEVRQGNVNINPWGILQ